MLQSHSHRLVAILDIFVSYVLFILVLALVRLFFIYRFASFSLFAAHANCLPLFFLNALRFDAQIAAYAVLPLLLVAILTLISPSRFAHFNSRFSHFYVPIIACLIGLIAMADVHYYANFRRHYDIAVFDFFNEDPAVLIRGILNEAPILLLLIAAFLSFAIANFLHSRALSRLERLSWRRWWPSFIALILILVVSLRGSFGVFTLRMEDVYVSSSTLINDCVPNAFYMLKKAHSEKKAQFTMLSDEEILAEEGFNSLNDAIYTYLGHNAPSLDSALIARTSPQAPFQDFNVVLIICESWGQKLLSYEQYGLDMLGSMRPHFQNDLVWQNFLSATNGTINTVETLTTSTPYDNLFASRYRDTPLPFSTARLWQRAGYDTHFISGIEIAWRNIMEVLPYQGFNQVVGKLEILDEWPLSPTNHTWGVYDHGMLDFLLARLENAPSARPQFIMALTSTNHTPFEFPKNFDMPDTFVPDAPDAFAISDDAVIKDYLRGYQYTSQCLGNFLNALKASPVGKKTIVAITGDHNTRLLPAYAPSDPEMQKYAVPLYLYIPDSAARSLLPPDATSRTGSHQDIIPTLANLTLSNAEFLNSGQNLLADSLPRGSYGVNVKCVISSNDLPLQDAQRRAAALRALKKIWFKQQFQTAQ